MYHSNLRGSILSSIQTSSKLYGLEGGVSNDDVNIGRNKITVTIENRTPDVPYGDHFYHLDKTVAIAPSAECTKIIVR